MPFYHKSHYLASTQMLLTNVWNKGNKEEDDSEDIEENSHHAHSYSFGYRKHCLAG